MKIITKHQEIRLQDSLHTSPAHSLVYGRKGEEKIVIPTPTSPPSMVADRSYRRCGRESDKRYNTVRPYTALYIYYNIYVVLNAERGRTRLINKV